MNNRQSGMKIMARLIKILKPLAPVMMITISFGVLGFLAAIAITTFGGVAIATKLGIDMSVTFKTSITVIIVCAVLRGLLRYIEQYSGHYIAFKILAILRDKVYKALRKLAPSKLESKEKGNLISVITSDIELLEVFYAHTVAPIAIAIITSIIIALVLGSINIYFGLISAGFYIIVGYVIPVFSSKYGNKAGVEYREEFAKTNSFLLESLKGIKEVLLFNQGEKRLAKINENSDRLNAKLDDIKKHEGIIRACTDVTIMIAILTFLFVGIHLMQNNVLNLGELIRQNIQNTYFIGQEHQPNKHITLSIGVSTYPKVAKTKKELIELADNALYRAKSFDKNRVERYYNILDEIDPSIDKKSLESVANMLNNINMKDKYTYGHSERVVIYAKKFATYLQMKDKDKKELLLGAYLHDIGKLEISKELLTKREKLSESEFNILRQHPTLGSDLVSSIKEFADVIPLIKYHHEKYDGTGYPSKLKGDDIPYLARILTIIDSFDAMTSKRPYNIRKDYKQAIGELEKCAGSHFDPELVYKFIEMLQNDMLEKKMPRELDSNLSFIDDINKDYKKKLPEII